tara:strand:- start:23555 stop:24217 length:663 start_codon:yes stop_codon:yes gene_type:complete
MGKTAIATAKLTRAAHAKMVKQDLALQAPNQHAALVFVKTVHRPASTKSGALVQARLSHSPKSVTTRTTTATAKLTKRSSPNAATQAPPPPSESVHANQVTALAPAENGHNVAVRSRPNKRHVTDRMTTVTEKSTTTVARRHARQVKQEPATTVQRARSIKAHVEQVSNCVLQPGLGDHVRDKSSPNKKIVMEWTTTVTAKQMSLTNHRPATLAPPRHKA